MSLPARLLTLLIPTAVAATLALLSTPDRTLDHAAASMDRRLRQSRPEVVILGSSVALRDIDRDQLAAALSLRPASVMKLTVPASTGAHWYAVLKYRVLGGRDHPRLVLIADALASLLTPDVEGHEARLRLADHLVVDDPVISARTFADGGGIQDERHRLKLRELRRAWVSAMPDALLGLMRIGDPSAGRQLVLDSTDRVFAPDRVDTSRHGGLPEMFRPPEPERLWRIPESPADSYLPDLLSLCEQVGCELLFVRMPFPPSFPEADRLPPQVEHEAAAWLAEHGGHYAELRSLALDDTLFSDREHTTPAGASIVTEAIAGIVRDRDLLGGSGSVGWVPPLAAGAVDGGAVELASGVALSAGQILRLSFDTTWPAHVDEVELRLRATSPTGDPVRAELSWDGSAEALDGLGRLRFTKRLPTPGPTTLTVRAHTDVQIDSVSLGVPLAMAWLVGDDVAARSGSIRLAGGRQVDHHVSPEFTAPPPEVPPGRGRVTRAGPRAARLALPELEALADADADPSVLGKLDEGAVAGNDFIADACSPVIVLEDGEPLPWPHAFCDHVSQLRGGRSCHVGGSVVFSGSDGSDPLTNRRAYTPALDPSRICRIKAQPGGAPLYDAIWLYPGDEVVLRAPEDRLSRLPWGADAIDLRAAHVLGPEEALRLVIPAADVDVVLDPALIGLGTTLRHELPAPVSADAEIRVRNGGRGWWLLTWLALVER